MPRATFRQRPPSRGIRVPASDRCRRPELLQQPQRLGLDFSTIAAHPRAACPLSDSLTIVAGAARRPALFPQLFPIPDPERHVQRAVSVVARSASRDVSACRWLLLRLGASRPIQSRIDCRTVRRVVDSAADALFAWQCLDRGSLLCACDSWHGIAAGEDGCTNGYGAAISVSMTLAGHVQDGVGFVGVSLQRLDRLGSGKHKQFDFAARCFRRADTTMIMAKPSSSTPSNSLNLPLIACSFGFPAL